MIPFRVFLTEQAKPEQDKPEHGESGQGESGCFSPRRLAVAALLAGSMLTPWPASALMPITPGLFPDAPIVTAQYRNNNQSGGFRDGGTRMGDARPGGFQGGEIYRSQTPRPPMVRPPKDRPPVGRPPPVERPPVGRPPFGQRPEGRPPRRPDGGWGGPVIYPDDYPRPRPRPRPPVFVDDFEDEYFPPPRRRPRPERRPVIVEIDDEPVVRRRVPARAAPPPVARPPAQTARRQPPRLPPVLVPPASERRLVRDEVLVELKDGVTADAVARRHRLTALSTERFTLANVTIVRYRVEGDRTARQALTAMADDTRIASAQPNFIFALQQLETKPDGEAAPVIEPAAPLIVPLPEAGLQPVIVLPGAPDTVSTAQPPAAVTAVVAVERKPQYILGKMGIEAAHRISRGNRIRVAVIDTAVDGSHPELEGVISRRFNAIGDAAGDATRDVTREGDTHGTAMAGAIMAKASLQGVSPAAELLVARAFTGGTPKPGAGAEGTTIHILKSLDWAHAEGARVVNLSFAGPQDRLMSRALAGASTRGMIAVAAAGNGGPQAAPLYPGADPSVIAVTATDADDRVYAQANTGSYIAVAAPGVDVIAAEPGRRYAFSSGTSMAAAHVSGLVALMLEQKADLGLAGVRAILSETALDLGPKGPDRVFGAGRIDAAAALARTLRSPTTP